MMGTAGDLKGYGAAESSLERLTALGRRCPASGARRLTSPAAEAAREMFATEFLLVSGLRLPGSAGSMDVEVGISILGFVSAPRVGDDVGVA